MSDVCVYMPPCKKLQSESDGDFISNLPDGIIGHILSRVPTEEAVRTCVLSRDWKYKWTSIYNILIHSNTKSSSFLSFMDSLLHLFCDSSITSFRLLCFEAQDTHRLTSLLSAILSRGIQVIEIDALFDDPFILPRFLASCTSLTKLKVATMSGGCLQIPDKNCFRNLKSLYLGGQFCKAFEILNHQTPHTGQLLLNFPVLEIMKLKCCKFVNVTSVEIWAPQLIIFKAASLFQINEYAIKIFGPKLAKFYSSCGYLENFVLDAPSVYYLDLDHHFDDGEDLESLAVRTHSLLKGFPGLTCLKLIDTTLQAYVNWRGGYSFTTFDRIKRLEVDSRCAKPLLELLKVMPYLESLIIKFWCNYKYEHKEPLALCIGSSLKEVTFIDFHGESDQFDLLKLLVDNAKKLERVYVNINIRRSMTDCEVRDKLSTMASKSPACVTISEKRPCSFEQETSLEVENEVRPWYIGQ